MLFRSEKHVDGKGQIVIAMPKQVRFGRGRLETSDPETIAVLDRMIAKGDTITRDYEVFLKNTVSDEMWAKHVSADNAIKGETIRSQQEEIERLKALVEGKK